MNLRRSFGVAFGVAVAIGSMIGAGILRAPADVAARLPLPALFLGAWVVGGAYALLGANALAELGTMVPRSGGQYVFVRRALGPYAGFLVGWNDWISTCGAVAAISLVLAEAVSTFAPALASQTVLVALVIVAIVTVILWRGARESDVSQQITSLLKSLALLALVAACLLARATGAVTLVAETTIVPVAVPTGLALAAAFVTALQGVIYAYDGWTGVLYFSEEVQNTKQIPRSLFLGVLSAIAIYLLLNIAFLAVLSLPALAASPLAAASAATAVFGPRGGTIVQVVVVLALPSAVIANTLMSSRVAFALGRDGAAPHFLAQVNKGGTPGAALITTSAVVGLFILLGGAVEKVFAVCAFLFVASYTLSFTSVFVLRRREPNADRPYRAKGHPWTTGLVLVGSVAFMGGVVAADPGTGLVALALVAVSYPIFKMTNRA